MFVVIILILVIIFVLYRCLFFVRLRLYYHHFIFLGLDVHTEKDLLKCIDDYCTQQGGVTRIIIAHRRSSIQNSNFAVVMDQGTVCQLGEHQAC